MNHPDGTLSVVVAALNEEKHLEATLRTLQGPLERWWRDWEILVFDDGSTDGTADIAEALAQRDEKVQAFHHRRPRSLGGVFRHGLDVARMEHIILLNGKDDTTAEALDAIFGLRDQADLVVPYTLNLHEHSASRRVLSRLFTGTLNILCGLNLHYYNHQVLYPRDLVLTADIRNDSYAFQAEILIDLLQRGHTFVEVGVRDRYDPHRRSRAFRAANFAGVARFLLKTASRVYSGSRRKGP